MGKEPRVTAEEREGQVERLYAQIGKIVVFSEHLNAALFQCSLWILHTRGLPQDYVQTVLAGQNLENMRRTWESLVKLHYAGDADTVRMIDHISNRADNIIRRRNDTVHRLWYIGWGNEETESYDLAKGFKAFRDIGKKGQGGTRYKNRDTKDFEEIIDELKSLTSLISRLGTCVIMSVTNTGNGKPANNFHYNKDGQLVDAPPPKTTPSS